MEFKFYLLRDRRLEHKIIKSAADKSVGFNIGVGHIVLGSQFILFFGDFLGLIFLNK
jgi:hypothetical protein